MEAALEGLAPRYREILTRYYLREQTQDQICADMGLTETQFRLLRSHAEARFGELGRRTLTTMKAVKAQGASPEDAAVNFDGVIQIVARAVAVFGDEQKASHWLSTPLPILGARSPAQIILKGDFDEIDQILTRIEHNIPS